MDDSSAKEVVNKLFCSMQINPEKKSNFYINSPGGVVTSGMVIYDTMKMIKSPVSTICIGLAASMGSILLSGGVREEIYLSAWRSDDPPAKYRRIYSGSERRPGNPGKTNEASKGDRCKDTRRKLWKKIEQIMKDFDRDYWMDAKEAIEYGIVDQSWKKFKPDFINIPLR